MNDLRLKPEAFRPDPFDLSDGYGVAKRLRQDTDFKSVVLVAMTGYRQESDRELSEDAGFNHHLVKPADFAKLQQILATVSANGT